MGFVQNVRSWLVPAPPPSILPPANPAPSSNAPSINPPTAAPSQPLSVNASASGSAYDAASNSYRLAGFQPARIGPTTALWSTLDLMRARCRDEVRNNAWASSAVDNAESQWVGNGIRPHWNIENLDLKAEIEKKFGRWAKRNKFYQKQATAAREIFEAGEVFARFYVRPASWKLKIPLEFELIAGEQVPVFLNTANGGQPGTPMANSIRTGIEFDPDNRIVAYHMYRAHPGEAMFYPIGGLTFVRVPAADVLHAFKPVRAGLLRGQPHLSAVLVLLHEINKYSDATVVKKVIQTMFAGFVEKPDAAGDILPIDSAGTGTSPQPAPSGMGTDPDTSTITPGSMNFLLPGEKINFPTLPQDNDIETVLRVWLHQFAVGCGATYEQITGDLKGVNLSSIRAGILDFRRKCEQLQRFLLIGELCEPIVKRWLKEAVLAGELSLPGYAADPEDYEDIAWGLPGWPWLDPVKDATANQMNVRAGFDSRENVCAQTGEDAAVIDAQQVADHNRTDGMGLVYDSDPRKILIGKEANPAVDEEGEPESEADVAEPAAPGKK